MSNAIAIVGELWKFPFLGIDEIPIALSMRFIGRKFAVDLGGLSTPSNILSVPYPLVNFTYHFQHN